MTDAARGSAPSSRPTTPSNIPLSLSPDVLDALADLIAHRVADLVVERLREQPQHEVWLDSRQAAEHLGVSIHALRHLVARRAVPFTQERPNGKMYFRASELDDWRDESHESSS